MDTVSVVVGLLGGVILGGIIAWLMLKQQMSKGQEALSEIGRLKSESERLQGIEEKLGSKETEFNLLNVKYQSYKSEADEREKSLLDRIADLKQVGETMKESFENLSNEALKKSGDDLLKQANLVLEKYKEQAESDKKLSQAEMEKLLDPFKTQLEKIETQNHELEKNRRGAYDGLITQVKSLAEQQSGLQKETSRLTKALQDPGSAGQWGEMVLERVVEMAGLQEKVNFDTQETLSTDEGNQRPDMIVQLPGGRTLIIDSKAPMKQYLSGLEEENEELKMILFKDHAKKLAEHAKALGKKDYSKIASAPDFTIMFIPSESAYRVALEQRPELLEDAMAQNVVLATPSTLLALLRAVNYGWSQEKLAQEAKNIQKLGVELYERFATMMGHYAKLGKAINDSAKHYNSTTASLDKRVVPSIDKFRQLGIQSNKEMPEIAVIETQTHSPSLPESEPDEVRN